MQIWTKLTLGFGVTATVIIGLYGGYQLRQEQEDLRNAAEHDLRLLGTVVDVGIANALRDKQGADVRALIAAVKLRDPAIDVLVFDRSGLLTVSSTESLDTRALIRAPVAEARAVGRVAILFEGPRGLSHLVGAFPVRDETGAALGTLAIVRPLDELRRDLSSEERATGLSLVTLIAGIVSAGWFLASIYVRRPLQGLVETIRAVRSGDLSARASFHRVDEIGAAIAEFNETVGELAEARAQLIAESESREALETNLERVDKLATVGQLSAGLAHEIGSPLQVLSGRAEALRTRTDLPQDARRSAQIISKESERITRIVEQLLTFSRRTAPSMAPVSLDGPVHDIVELVEPEARRLGVLLVFECEDALPLAIADAGQVQQLTMNLVRNALRASSRGGVVRTKLNAALFVGRDGRTRPGVRLIVEDTGHGIAAEMLPHIFEPFFTTGAETGGTGLGLAVVKSIVDAHGGTISVTASPGGGSRFTAHFRSSHSVDAGETTA